MSLSDRSAGAEVDVLGAEGDALGAEGDLLGAALCG